MKYISLTTFLFVFGISVFSQNVAINSTGATADASSMLDVSSTNTGFLVPRITLTATNVAAPVTNPANSLLIYNTATNGTGNTAVTPGFYYWVSATSSWTRLVNKNDAWLTTGNYLSGNGIFGTMTNFSVNLGTNGLARGAIMNTGEFFLNGAMTYFGGDIFSAYATGSNSAVNGYLTGTGDGNAAYFGLSSSGAATTIWANSNSTNANSSVLYSEITTGAGWNIYAVSPAGNTRATIAGNTATLNSTAVVGSVNGTGNMVTLAGGSGGAFTHPATGVWGAASTVASGTGGSFGGNGVNVSTLTTGSGVAGTGTSTGVYGLATTAASGNGALFGGNNIVPFNLAAGSGVSGTGSSTGVFGYATTNVNGSAGGYFARAGGTFYTYVSANIGGTNYKVYGTGTVSTVVPDLNEKPVIMFCPESPEMMFQDFGKGTLVNGVAYINLDPVFAKNVKIDNEHPLRVMVQLEGDCKGVYVTDKTANGFTVKELQNGNSNVNFTWFVSANRVDTKDMNGNVISLNEDLRFPNAPGNPEIMQSQATDQTSVQETKEVTTPVKTEVKVDPGPFKKQ